MALETGTYLNDLVSTNPVGGTDSRTQGDDHLRLIKATLQATFPNMAGAAWRTQSKATNYTVLAVDNMSMLVSSAALTLAFTSAATLGNKHMILVYAEVGDVTLDPNGSETVNGGTTLVIPAGQACLVVCTGTAFYALGFVNAGTFLGKLQGQIFTAFTTGGSATAYTLTPVPASTANTTNQRFRVTFHTAAGTTPTLAVSGQTAKDLKYKDSAGTKQAITATQVPTGWVSDVEYDGTDWVVMQPVGVMTATVGGAVPAPPNNTTTFLRGDGTFAVPAGGLTLGTKQAGSGTAENVFTSLPAGIKRISLNFNALSTNGTSIIIAQLGDSGGYKTSGYAGAIETASSRYTFTDGFKLVGVGAASWAMYGRVVFELLDAAAYLWTGTVYSADSAGGAVYLGAGSITLSGALDRLRVTTQGGSDTIDVASAMNILYE